jgi:hypothetical protein
MEATMVEPAVYNEVGWIAIIVIYAIIAFAYFIGSRDFRRR